MTGVLTFIPRKLNQSSNYCVLIFLMWRAYFRRVNKARPQVNLRCETTLFLKKTVIIVHIALLSLGVANAT
jgi:hypothetical protein